MAVEVTVVRSETESEDTPIPFLTYYRDDSSLPEGDYAELQAGADGYVHRGYAVTYENGAAGGRPPPAGDPRGGRSLGVWATWYTAASAGGGNTATGTIVGKGTVAVDPRGIPLGTQMYIPVYGYGVAGDTGGAIIGNIIDLGYGPNDVKDWQSGWVDICILN